MQCSGRTPSICAALASADFPEARYWCSAANSIIKHCCQAYMPCRFNHSYSITTTITAVLGDASISATTAALLPSLTSWLIVACCLHHRRLFSAIAIASASASACRHCHWHKYMLCCWQWLVTLLVNQGARTETTRQRRGKSLVNPLARGLLS